MGEHGIQSAMNLPSRQSIDELIGLMTRGSISLEAGAELLHAQGAQFFGPDGLPEKDPTIVYIGDRFEKTGGLDFEWIVEYTDGTTLRQFELDGTQNHFGHIDQSRLGVIEYRSTFIMDGQGGRSDGPCIVRMDMATGNISVVEGDADIDVHILAMLDPYPGPKKPILFMRNGRSFGPLGVLKYNRYVLGWEAEGGIKRAVCIKPNGTIVRCQ